MNRKPHNATVTMTPALARALATAIRKAGLPRLSEKMPAKDRDAYVGFVIWTWAQEIEAEQDAGAL